MTGLIGIIGIIGIIGMIRTIAIIGMKRDNTDKLTLKLRLTLKAGSTYFRI